MARLDPVGIFNRLGRDIPPELRKHLVVTGSLAAAYEFRVSLQGNAVNTKDADIVVYPAGDVASAQGMAQALLRLGWHPTENCTPMPTPDPHEKLRAIRLWSPGSNHYFIELLNVPQEEQAEPKKWVPVQLPDGWYGLPSFKFMGLTVHGRHPSAEGLDYASPAMMALANLLSHPKITGDEIETGTFKGVRRCSKDLGRVLALAFLAGRDATIRWTDQWHTATHACFPKTWANHIRHTGAGLRELLDGEDLMNEANKTTEIGLLSGMNQDVAALRAVGLRLLGDVIEGFEQAGAAEAERP